MKACAAALLEWVRELGEPEPCTECAQPVEGAHLQPALAWLDDEHIGELPAE